MKKLLATGGALLICGLAGVGCQNTAQGVKEDTAKNASAVNEGAQKASAAAEKSVNNAAHAVKEGAKNANANLNVRPKVKDAIMADKELNNTANEVHVDANDTTVTLSGHVLTNEMKQRAGQIAAKTIKEDNATQTVQNNLTVTK